MAKVKKARRYTSLILAILIIFAILISFFWPKNQFQLLKERLIHNPNDFEAHLELAERFLANNQYKEAEKELAQCRILETSTSKFGELVQKKLLQSPADINKLIAAWEKIVTEKPDYRDGWLQLAYLSYKIYEDDKAKEYLAKAINLDPNYQPAQQLAKIIGE